MSVLFLQGDGYTYDGIDLTGESSLTISLEDNGTAGLTLDYLVLSGTTSVSIKSFGDAGGYNALHQLADISNVLTTVTLKGSEPFTLGSPAGASNAGDGVVTFGSTLSTKIASSLTLIDASATTGGVKIFAGATNTNSEGAYVVNEVSGETITYTGLTIKGGSGNDVIENDAKNGIVTDGNGADPRNEGLALPATLADFVGHIPFLGKPPCCGKPVGRERQSPRLDTWQKG